MSVVAMIMGRVSRPPERREARNGNSFVICSLRVENRGRMEFWRVVAFGEGPRQVLESIGEGDAVTVSGPIECGVYTPEGQEPRPNLSIVAEHALPLRSQRRPARPKPEELRRPKPNRAAKPRDEGAVDPELNDPVLF